MGDAEDAQLNALSKMEGPIRNSKKLMCVFHVLYNVYKRVKGLAMPNKLSVFNGIYDMHFSTSNEEYLDHGRRVLLEWRNGDASTAAFADYFEKTWMHSQYWRWQVFHSPMGFAVTNNPCEIFNKIVKTYTSKKFLPMKALMEKLQRVAEDVHMANIPSFQ